MTKTKQILAATETPHTRAQLQEKFGKAANGILQHLVTKGAVRRYIYQRTGEERGKQQREYITVFEATGRKYVSADDRYQLKLKKIVALLDAPRTMSEIQKRCGEPVVAVNLLIKQGLVRAIVYDLGISLRGRPKTISKYARRTDEDVQHMQRGTPQQSLPLQTRNEGRKGLSVQGLPCLSAEKGARASEDRGGQAYGY